MISVIVVYNDLLQFDSMLRASLERQRVPFELIALDNRAKAYASAASALNEGSRRATGEILFFAHQDIRFESDQWLEDAERYLSQLPDAGIAGVAGARPAGDAGSSIVISNIEDSVPPQRAGHVALHEPQLVDTVDECAFFVPKRVFDRGGFDERTCRGWHLYAVDLSLSIREAGLRAYVLPLALYHRSGGATVQFMGIATYERAYFSTLHRVLRKHGQRWDRLHTTCGTWSTHRPVLLQRFPPSVVRQVVSGWMGSRLRRSP